MLKANGDGYEKGRKGKEGKGNGTGGKGMEMVLGRSENSVMDSFSLILDK